MTRGQLKTDFRASIMQGLSSPLRQYSGPVEDQALDWAADRVAQMTDCYFSEQITDIVAGQTEYCAPKVYKPKDYYTLDANGNRQPLSRMNTREMDRNNWNWRQWVDAEFPSNVVSDGSTTLTIAPATAGNITGGLIIAGFCLSTLPAAGHTTHQWDDDDDECPLPDWAHEAVRLGYAVRRLESLMAREPQMAGPLLARAEKRYMDELKMVEQAAVNAYRSLRLDRGHGHGFTGWY